MRIPRPFVKYVLGSASEACSTFNGAFSKLAPFISHAVSLHRAGSISRYAKLGKQTAAPPKISICVPFAEVLPSNLVSPPIIHHSNPQFLLYKHPYYSYFIRYVEIFQE